MDKFTNTDPDPLPERLNLTAELMAQGLNPAPPEPDHDAEAEAYTEQAELIAPPGIELLELTGRGGMGEVYKARQINLDRVVAVKFLAPEIAGDPLFLSRLEREARIMAKLRHPHLVGIHQFEWLPGGGAAIVMEWVEGGNLRHVMNAHEGGRLPWREAREVVRQVGGALALAHASGIIHRDLKPENILMDAGGAARVTDFGLALALTEQHTTLTRSGTTVGTLDYMAPEQTRGRDVDERSDIYALGAIFYEMLTGDLPRGHFDPPHVQVPEVPPTLSTAIMHALRNVPGERFQSMEQMLAALETGSSPEALPTATTARKASWTLPLAAISLLVLLAVAGSIFYQPVAPDPVVQSPEAPPAVALQETPLPLAPEPDPEPEPQREPAPTIAPVAAPEPEPTPTPVVASEPPAAESAWRDALTGVDPNASAISGQWRREGRAVVSDSSVAILALNAPLPESYDVRVNFTRREGIHSIALFFRQNASIGSVELDAWERQLAGVQLIDSQDLRNLPAFTQALQNGRAYQMEIRVRPGSVTVAVDGQDRGTFRTAGSPLNVPYPWAWNPNPRETTLAIGSYESATRFDSVQWRPARP